MKITYKPTGVCCKQIEVWVEEGIIKHVKFTGGCPGGMLAISKLVEGKHVDEVIEVLHDVKCGDKKTSCAMQLCKALELYDE